ncbi:hypothetical protein OG485_05715 [Streptomyces sp. NBC_00328]|nr:hypothetical protein [Streptomyces sp. NBC_00328]
MSEPATSTPTPRQVAESMYEALLHSDRATLAAITSPEIRIHVTKALAYGGEYTGLLGFAALFKNTFDCSRAGSRSSGSSTRGPTLWWLWDVPAGPAAPPGHPSTRPSCMS